jgi:hypothetical protein
MMTSNERKDPLLQKLIGEPPSQSTIPSPPPSTETVTRQWADPFRKKNWDRLVKEIADEIEVDPQTLLAKDRRAFLVKARRKLFYLARQRHKWSLPVIADLAHVHHATIIHAIQKHCLSEGLPLPHNMRKSKRYHVKTVKADDQPE